MLKDEGLERIRKYTIHIINCLITRYHYTRLFKAWRRAWRYRYGAVSRVIQVMNNVFHAPYSLFTVS